MCGDGGGEGSEGHASKRSKVNISKSFTGKSIYLFLSFSFPKRCGIHRKTRSKQSPLFDTYQTVRRGRSSRVVHA